MRNYVKQLKEKISFQLLERFAAITSFNQRALLGKLPVQTLSPEDYFDYRHALYQAAKRLRKTGWTVVAIRQYVKKVTRSTTNDYLAVIQAADAEVKRIGSPLFNQMLEVAYPTGKKDAIKTLNLLFRLVGATVDEHQFLQLENVALAENIAKESDYQFTQVIEDAIDFDHVLSQIVQQVYPSGITDNGSPASFLLAQMTHQFRYYLDWKNNLAMRVSYPAEVTDLKRLQRHYAIYGNLAGEKARLHNKYQGAPSKYPPFVKVYGENVKYVSAPYFHSEWIIDQQGAFVTQWNAYSFDQNNRVLSDPTISYSFEKQRQIVDGNSVNYANNSRDYRPTIYGIRNLHTLLDATPVGNYDPAIRKQVMKSWHSPVLTAGELDFFDTKQSEQKANDWLEGSG